MQNRPVSWALDWDSDSPSAAWLLAGSLPSSKLLQGVLAVFDFHFFIVSFSLPVFTTTMTISKGRLGVTILPSCPQLSFKSLSSSYVCSVPWKSLEEELEGHAHTLLHWNMLQKAPGKFWASGKTAVTGLHPVGEIPWGWQQCGSGGKQNRGFGCSLALS